MGQEIYSPILTELGKMYVSLHNEGRQMNGSTFIIQKNRYEEFINSLPKQNKESTLKFMDCEIVCSDVETETDEILFIENSLDIDGNFGQERKELLKNSHSQIADGIRKVLAERKQKILEALKSRGIVFADDEAFKQFAKTQLEHGKTEAGEEVVMYGSDVLIKFSNDFKVKQDD